MAYSFEVADQFRLFKQNRQVAEQRFEFLLVQDRIFNLKNGRPIRNKSGVILNQLLDPQVLRERIAIFCCSHPQVIGFHPHTAYSFHEVSIVWSLFASNINLTIEEKSSRNFADALKMNVASNGNYDAIYTCGIKENPQFTVSSLK